MKDFCIILVFNRKFLQKARATIEQIRSVGSYKGEIVCIIGDDLRGHEGVLFKDKKIIVKYFPDVGRTNEENDLFKVHKPFQFHKFYCFHTYFRENYKRCFYMDVGTFINKPIDKIINLDCTGKILAHSDAYPGYKYKLRDQFDNEKFPSMFARLEAMYNLDVDYFQSTIMLYDTRIIEDDTFYVLVKLSNAYHNNKTNSQGFMNLYFNCLLKKWKQIKIKDDETYYYDFYERFGLTTTDYIMLKYPLSEDVNKESFGGWSFSIELYYWILLRLSRGKTILELGSGDATRELTRYYKVYSIEHEEKWIGHAKKSNYIHAPLVKYDGYSWYDIERVKKLMPKKYDLILVDGPQGNIGREGFLRNIELFKTDVPIIIDDTDRVAEKAMRDALVKKLNKKVTTLDGAGKKFSVLL